MRFRLLLLACLCANPIICLAQPDTLWTRAFGGDSWDQAFDVKQTTDGGFIIVGYTQSYGAGSTDVYLIKTDSDGDTLWTNTYGTGSSEIGNSVAQTTDGGYIIVGSSDSFSLSEDILLIKTDSFGNVCWEQGIDAGGTDYAKSVQQTFDGGYIIAGRIRQAFENNYDILLVRTDQFGNPLWIQAFEDLHHGKGESAVETADGGFVVAGWGNPDPGFSDVILIKTDWLGEQEWCRTYGGEDDEFCFSVQQTTDDGFILAGSTGSFGNGGDAYLIKTDVEGNEQWSQTYGGSLLDEFYSVRQTADGGYICVGITDTVDYWEWYDFYLVKTDEYGNCLWSQNYGNGNIASEEWAYSVCQTSDFGYIVAGHILFPGNGYDVYLMRLAPDIVPVNPEDDSDKPILEKLLHPPHPNPFNPTTQLIFTLPVASTVTLDVFDVAGSRVGG